MFHQWTPSGDDTDDQCIRCGVVCEYVTDGPVLVDYGPLPIECPGPDIPNTHHFAFGPVADTLECHCCSLTIGPDTRPADVDWHCKAM